ncbi:sensor histidine kinase [Geomonas propionica]|uniref:histidine kinase n=1 Tax=Geomonas propionica TaxID=2798582 RepID=A0ABS0YXM1_9BACT|nr:ATP-binding protein [Geomonas propionica]MBJ6802235.1 GHKL domain-containing protein [Geomonas propionica]
MTAFFRTLKLPLALALIVALTVSAVITIRRANSAVRAEARARFFEQYNRQQYLVAELTAHSLDEMFATFSRNLELVASLFDDKQVDRRQAQRVKAHLEKVYGSLLGTPVIDLVVFDKNGVAVAIEPHDDFTLGRSYAWRDYYRWVRDQRQPGRMYISPFMRMEGGRYRGVKELIVARGIYGPRGEFNGVVACTLNFDQLARKHVLSVRVGRHGQAWLMDSTTRTVLVDPNGRIAGQTFEEALRQKWPRLYDLLISAGNGKPGSGWYEYEDPADPRLQVRKLVSYHPVRLQNRLWTVGVTTPEREVEALLSSFLQRQEAISTTLLVTIVGVATLLLALLYHWNRTLAAQVGLHTRALTQAHARLKSTFDELLVAKKVAATGHLALGLAHEIRNPLSAIRMNMQMIRKRIEPSGVMYENFSIVEGEIKRLNRLLKDVLDFAKPRPLRLQPVLVAEMVGRLLQLMSQRLQDRGIGVSTDIDPGLQLVCDPEQVHQVLLNLVLNAMEAMEERPERSLRITALRQGGQALIAVKDTGAGIPRDKCEQLFDPFYTTKASGGGLGLSILQTIVVNHCGVVSVTSEPGEGATFTITLPLSPPGNGEVT